MPRLDKDTLSEKEIEYLLYLKDIYPSLDSLIRSQIESESLVLAFPLEREPKFALLEAHYKGTKLWGDISRYKQVMGTYLSVGFKFHKTLMTQVYPLLLQGIEEAKLFLEGLRELVRVELAPVRVKLFSEGIQTGQSTILEELPDPGGKPLKQFLEFVNRYKNRVKDESKNNMQQAQDDGRVILELVDRLEKNYEIMKRLNKVILRGVEEEKLKGMLPAGIKRESCPSA